MQEAGFLALCGVELQGVDDGVGDGTVVGDLDGLHVAIAAIPFVGDGVDVTRDVEELGGLALCGIVLQSVGHRGADITCAHAAIGLEPGREGHLAGEVQAGGVGHGDVVVDAVEVQAVVELAGHPILVAHVGQGAIVGAHGIVGRGARALVELPPGDQAGRQAQLKAVVGDVVAVGIGGVGHADLGPAHVGVGDGPGVGAVVGRGGHDGVDVGDEIVIRVLKLDIGDGAGGGPGDALLAVRFPDLAAVGSGQGE